MMSPLFFSSQSGVSIVADDRLEVLQIYSLLQYIHKGDKERIKQIVEHGVENIINLTEPKDGIGVLHMVVSANNYDLISYLLSLGANPNVQDGKGRTPIMLAAQLGYEEIVTLLIDNEADLLLQDAGGHGVLFYCIYPSKHHAHCLQLALKGGADVNNVSAQGVHVFQRMCEEAEKCAPLCFFMLEAGADPKAVNKTTGVTALMAASKAGSLQLVRAILKKGGDPNALSTERLSAVHLAAEVGSLEVIQVLSAYSANMQALTLKSCTALHYAAASGCNPKLKNQDDCLPKQTAKACKQNAAAKELQKVEKQLAKYKCSPRMLRFYDWSQENQNELEQACGEELERVPKKELISVIEGLGAPIDTDQLNEIVSANDEFNMELINLNDLIKAENYIEKAFLHSSFVAKEKKGKGGKKATPKPDSTQPSEPMPQRPNGDLLLKIIGKVTNHTDTRRFDSHHPPAHHLADDSAWYIKKPQRTFLARGLINTRQMEKMKLLLAGATLDAIAFNEGTPFMRAIANLQSPCVVEVCHDSWRKGSAGMSATHLTRVETQIAV
uniref:Ankyrin repeat and EF-hand domain containing 1a n=1 Tax=Gouania willdenowi TaxID=441366 RepID=A0A8C5EJN3_GOUWI